MEIASPDLVKQLSEIGFNEKATADNILKFIPDEVEGCSFYHSQHKYCYIAGYGLHLIHAQYERKEDSFALVLIWLAENNYLNFKQTI
jgi:hypothetical protein